MDIDNLLPEEEVTDIADFFKVFGDPTRLRILFLLDSGEANVNTISGNLGISQSVTS
ncbi:MAG: helix-turn-helix transcriptional regulator, partial [Spirochaetales bacterium]|nr:helix-turn-helix transcriptional regulator [Spirochaetales bacterium]